MQPAEVARSVKAENRLTAEMLADLKAIGANVRVERKKRGLSLGKMAREIGCSLQMLGHVERASYKPSWELYWTLTKYFRKGPMPLTR